MWTGTRSRFWYTFVYFGYFGVFNHYTHLFLIRNIFSLLRLKLSGPFFNKGLHVLNSLDYLKGMATLENTKLRDMKMPSRSRKAPNKKRP